MSEAAGPGGEAAGDELFADGSLTIADVHEAIAAARPGEECIVFRDRRLTWADVTDRTRRLANALHARGLGCRRERQELAPWESGQDHLAIYLHNGNEYLEAMLGAFKARVAPFNVNYRYVAEELRYLLVDSGATAIVFHSAFAPVLAGVLAQVPSLQLLLQVADDSANGLLPGAIWYEDALAAASAERPSVAPSPDDLYILYTGGTTGMPKGVLWRQGDALTECFGASPAAATIDDLVAEASATSGVSELRALIAPPFMHGAGHWIAFRTWLAGGTVIVQSNPAHLDPVDIWSLAERERVTFLLIVGDAFARPLLDELDRASYDLSALTVILSGGAPLATHLKAELLAHMPTVMIVDGLGSSEAGGQLSQVSVGTSAIVDEGPPLPAGTFLAGAGSHVLNASLNSLLRPGSGELGWLAKRGRLALGYLGDVEKTERTYPTVDGVRYAVPGDRARLRADGTIELHGRDSVTINSGGEKVFAEEVEAAVKAHPAVYDCIVAARPSERWGQEVVAVVRLREGSATTGDELAAEAARHIARYKVPKSFVFVTEIIRSPAGKADYRWARDVAANSSRSNRSD